MVYTCQSIIDAFNKLKASFTSPIDMYLSYRSKDPSRRERLVDHLSNAVEHVESIKDHLATALRLVRKLEYEVYRGGSVNEVDLRKAILDVVRFVALYHDIGKAEAHYQAYAHNLCEVELPPPHNYSSIAFLIHNDDIYLSLIENLTNVGLSLKTADAIYLASLVAIAMHHEYYDYRDASFLEHLSPLTLSLAKRLNLETVLYFDDSVYDVIEKVVEMLGIFIPKPRRRGTFTAVLGNALEQISSLHYEFGALRIDPREPKVLYPERKVEVALSLAETLTWMLTIMDNLAARFRGQEEEKEVFSFARIITKYYP